MGVAFRGVALWPEIQFHCQPLNWNLFIYWNYFRIILERIRIKTETEIADEQAGFRQGRGDKRSNHESQNTDAQGTRAPTTTLYVLCGLQEGDTIRYEMLF